MWVLYNSRSFKLKTQGHLNLNSRSFKLFVFDIEVFQIKFS